MENSSNRKTTFRQQATTFAEETLDTQWRKGSQQAGIAVVSGAPRWVTPELVADTIEIWQPYYESRLTEHDAVEILLSVSELVDVLEQAA